MPIIKHAIAISISIDTTAITSSSIPIIRNPSMPQSLYQLSSLLKLYVGHHLFA